jgi:pimeloyl-ACP methyl ester carboxylesterase
MEIAAAERTVFAATGGQEFDPNRPAVLFLHGAGMDHTVWALQTRWFAHHGRSVLALDLPGHGRSLGPALRSIEEMAELTCSVIARVGARRIALVGHSMGALVALEAAARLGTAASGLALLGAAPQMPVHPELLAAAERGEHGAVDLMVTWAVGRAAQLGCNDAPGLWLTGAALRLLERADRKSLAADLAACDGYRGAIAAAARCACPTLLVLGGDDRMTPPSKGADFARAFANGRARMLRQAGHMMMLEDPSGTLAALKEVA